jgi:hypothetical protein
MTLGSTQPLTEISTRNFPGGKGWPELKTDSLTATCGPVVCKMCEPRRLTTLSASTVCYRDSFTMETYRRMEKQVTQIHNTWARWNSMANFTFVSLHACGRNHSYSVDRMQRGP